MELEAWRCTLCQDLIENTVGNDDWLTDQMLNHLAVHFPGETGVDTTRWFEEV